MMNETMKYNQYSMFHEKIPFHYVTMGLSEIQNLQVRVWIIMLLIINWSLGVANDDQGFTFD